MSKMYGRWKGVGGLTQRQRMPKSPRKMAYNLPVSVGETSKRRRKGTKRWSFIIKKRKGPQRVLGIRSQKELMKRKSVRARYIKALLLEPIRTDSLPINDLLTQWKIPELSRLLPPLFDRITDPGARNWPYPVWTFDDGRDPALAPTVFMLPKIAIQPPELTSAFLPSMEPMVMPARPAPISPEIQPFEPVDLDIEEPDYEAPVPTPAPAWVEPVQTPHPSYEPPRRLEYPEFHAPEPAAAPEWVPPVQPAAPIYQNPAEIAAPEYQAPSVTPAPTYQAPDVQRQTYVDDSKPFQADPYKADPPWVIIRVNEGVAVKWYPLFAWKRISWIQVFDGSSMLIHDADESQLLKDSVSSWNVNAELAKVSP